MRHIDGQRGVETNHLAFTIVEPREPIHGENQFLMKPPKPAWILAPRPGLEPGTYGLTVYRSISTYQLLSSFSAPQFTLKSPQIIDIGPKSPYFCGANFGPNSSDGIARKRFGI